jgi:CRP-like cAMP-binding protein
MSRLLELAGDAPEVEFAPGDVIIQEGRPLKELFFLKAGEVEIHRDFTVIGNITKKGSALGEISALLGLPSTASVIARKPCTFIVIPDGAAFLAANHEATLEIARLLAQRLNWMTGTYVEQIYDD